HFLILLFLLYFLFFYKNLKKSTKQKNQYRPKKENMKSLKLVCLVTFLLNISVPSYAVFGYTNRFIEDCKQASAKYCKRGRALDAIVLNALSSKNNLWVRKEYQAYGEDTEKFTTYTPEQAHIKYPERSFT